MSETEKVQEIAITLVGRDEQGAGKNVRVVLEGSDSGAPWLTTVTQIVDNKPRSSRIQTNLIGVIRPTPGGMTSVEVVAARGQVATLLMCTESVEEIAARYSKNMLALWACVGMADGGGWFQQMVERYARETIVMIGTRMVEPWVVEALERLAEVPTEIPEDEDAGDPPETEPAKKSPKGKAAKKSP